MYESLIEQAILGWHNLFIIDDKVHLIGDTCSSSTGTLEQTVGSETVSLALSHGISLETIEKDDYLQNRRHVDHKRETFIEDQLTRENPEKLDHMNRYNLVKYIVQELFQHMVSAELSLRVQSIIGGEVRAPSSAELIAQGIGELTDETTINWDVKQDTLQRIHTQYYEPISSHPVFRGAADVTEGSVYNRLTKATPLLIFGGRVYICDRPGKRSSTQVRYKRKIFRPDLEPLNSESLIDDYREALAQNHTNLAVLELTEQLEKFDQIVVSDVKYFPLMGYDQFEIPDQNVGFIRNGDYYYAYRVIKKFARQTHFDENLFWPMPHDKDGNAGRFGIGLKVVNAEIKYLGYSEQEGGVVYWGPIEEDGPFRSEVPILNPVLAAKFPYLRTICHVSGYPHFPCDPDGFETFMNYALNNFLSSLRKGFIMRHHQELNLTELLDNKQLITKQQAIDQGYQLVNIHNIEHGIEF